MSLTRTAKAFATTWLTCRNPVVVVLIASALLAPLAWAGWAIAAVGGVAAAGVLVGLLLAGALAAALVPPLRRLQSHLPARRRRRARRPLPDLHLREA